MKTAKLAACCLKKSTRQPSLHAATSLRLDKAFQFSENLYGDRILIPKYERCDAAEVYHLYCDAIAFKAENVVDVATEWNERQRADGKDGPQRHMQW